MEHDVAHLTEERGFRVRMGWARFHLGPEVAGPAIRRGLPSARRDTSCSVARVAPSHAVDPGPRAHDAADPEVVR